MDATGRPSRTSKLQAGKIVISRASAGEIKSSLNVRARDEKLGAQALSTVAKRAEIGRADKRGVHRLQPKNTRS